MWGGTLWWVLQKHLLTLNGWPPGILGRHLEGHLDPLTLEKGLGWAGETLGCE